MTNKQTMPNIQITSRSKSVEPPFTDCQLIKIINDNHKLSSAAELIAKIGKELDRISSKHKFIIQYTQLKLESTNVDVDICTDFVAYWDSTKDGCVTVEVLSSSQARKENQIGELTSEKQILDEAHLERIDDSEVVEDLLVENQKIANMSSKGDLNAATPKERNPIVSPVNVNKCFNLLLLTIYWLSI